MTKKNRRFPWREIKLGLVVVALGLVAIVVSSLRVSRAEVEPDEIIARQVTVFGVSAAPGDRTTDSRLVRYSDELSELIPLHGFKLLDAQSSRIVDGESVTCALGNGYLVKASLVKAQNENGKVEIRCELFHDQTRQFSTLVKSPLHQLFFCQEALPDGTQLLIGIGAR
jgi:hypothetical protein